MKVRLLLATLILSACAFAAEVFTPTQDGIVYGAASGQTLTMDYYAPKGKGPHPIAIIIHGGGYQRGDSKSGSEAYCADFDTRLVTPCSPSTIGWRRGIRTLIWSMT